MIFHTLATYILYTSYVAYVLKSSNDNCVGMIKLIPLINVFSKPICYWCFFIAVPPLIL